MVALVAILAFDLFLLVTDRKTMTRWMKERAVETPLLPLWAGLMVGLLLGHLYL